MTLSWLLSIFDGKYVRRAFFALIIGMALTICGCIVTAKHAGAHEAMSLSGKPLGFNWPSECCGGQDCAFIPSSAVHETPEGYQVTLKAGQHPMLHTKDYIGVIPYGRERVSPTGDYAICLGHEGNVRFCFFAGSRGF